MLLISRLPSLEICLGSLLHCTHRLGVGMVAGRVTDSAVANETVSWEQIGVTHRGEKHLLGLGKQPLNGDVTEHWGHGLLQDLDHLPEAKRRTKSIMLHVYDSMYMYMFVYVSKKTFIY